MRYSIHVKPGSKKGPLVEVNDDSSLTVFLRERAIEGAANDGLVKVLATHFGVRQNQIEIETGFTSRIKRVRVDGLVEGD